MKINITLLQTSFEKNKYAVTIFTESKTPEIIVFQLGAPEVNSRVFLNVEDLVDILVLNKPIRENLDNMKDYHKTQDFLYNVLAKYIIQILTGIIIDPSIIPIEKHKDYFIRN